LKILLDFQLSAHEVFLKAFLELFKQIDTDNNGVIDQDQFRDLVRSLNVGTNEADLTRLLDLVDPHGNGQTTFSECVTVFASETIASNGEPLSVL
jgi:Ca2+-binding EF-hand superfamily protein